MHNKKEEKINFHPKESKNLKGPISIAHILLYVLLLT